MKFSMKAAAACVIWFSLAVSCATSVAASPITTGWAPVSACGASYDGADLDACAVFGLHDGTWQEASAPWRFPAAPGVTWTQVFGITAFNQGVVSQTADGAFDYVNPETGDHYVSDGYGAAQLRLVRQPLSAELTRYLVLVEDMAEGKLYSLVDTPHGYTDWDFNDRVLQAFETTVPVNVPEPASLVLFGLASLAVARRVRR